MGCTDIPAIVLVITAPLLTGRVLAQDAVSTAEKAEESLGIMETKAIAEEGFIYGLPLMMSYAIMYAYSVDRSSGSYTAPINQQFNEARVYTYKNTEIPLPNTHRSVFRSLHGSARGADRSVGP
jgi:hypothetical protein